MLNLHLFQFHNWKWQYDNYIWNAYETFHIIFADKSAAAHAHGNVIYNVIIQMWIAIIVIDF